MLVKPKPSRFQTRTVARKNRNGNGQNRLSPINNKYNHITRKNYLADDKVVTEAFSQPIWLRGLFLLKTSSSIFCLLMITTMFVFYGVTVYAPQGWTREYQKLKALQKNERQITSTNEIIKDQLAEQAVKQETGLVNPDPTKPAIFLGATPTQTLDLEPITKSQVKPPEVLPPLAY
jgi:hypothetical protein